MNNAWPNFYWKKNMKEQFLKLELHISKYIKKFILNNHEKHKGYH